ncbi:hypothetical protein ACET3Z_016821 [Daucus carota]
MKGKGMPKAGDEVESKSELQKSASTPCLYMFAHLHPRRFGYVLYKIDYKHLLDSDSDSNSNINDDEGISTPLPLMPFLVFYSGDLPDRFCSLVHLGDYLYFLGEKQSDFFKIAKSDIQHLVPSEHNVGSDYLKRLEPPMNSHKHEPIVFVAKGNLYAISRINHIDSPFEMFSPSKNSWTILNPRPRGPYGPFKSHVLLGDNLYFATSPLDPDFFDHDESIFSYNLTHNLWKLLTTSCRPAFEHPILPIANMLFGGFSLPFRGIQSTVAASPYTVLNHSDTDAKAMFMRPTLAPESNFWPEFFLRDNYAFPLCSPSYYMTDLGHENVLCFISYGQHPRSADIMAFFTFFKIPGDFWSADPVLLGKESNDRWNFCHYATQVDSDSKHAVKSYFKSEFMHRKLFKISTDELLVDYGRLITCFSY